MSLDRQLTRLDPARDIPDDLVDQPAARATLAAITSSPVGSSPRDRRSKVLIGVGGGVLVGALGIGVVLAGMNGRTGSPEQTVPAPQAVSANTQRDPQAFAQGVEIMHRYFDVIDGFAWEWELREALPNVLYSVDGTSPRPASDLVVVGTVTATRPGPGFADAVQMEGVPLPEVPFDSPEAVWSVMYLTLEVERRIGSEESVPSSLEVEVTLGHQPSNGVMLRALAGQRVLAFLNGPGTYLRLDSSAYTVGLGGKGLGFIADGGTISMPYQSGSESRYIGDLTTIEAVLAEATKPTTVIEINDIGERKDPSTYPSWSGRN